MLAPGALTLGDILVSAAGDVVGPWTDVDGARGATFEITRSVIVGGDPAVRCFVQTTVDGIDAIDVACVASTWPVIFNIVAIGTEQIAATDGTMTDNTVQNIIGTKFRMKVRADGPLSEPVTVQGRFCVR